MKSEFERRGWDSDFFGKEIFSLILQGKYDDAQFGEVIRRCFKEDAAMSPDLVYIMSPSEWPVVSVVEKELADASEHISIGLVDVKVVYGMDIPATENTSERRDDIEMSDIKEWHDAKSLYRLAYRAGHKSRFSDKRFGVGKFQEMYRVWIDNSINHMMATNVLVYPSPEDNSLPVGMLTLSIKDKSASIGLLATEESVSGRGIGKKLMRYAVRLCQEAGVSRLTVATQAENHGACRFYERCGFSIDSKTDIYHLWFSDKGENGPAGGD